MNEYIFIVQTVFVLAETVLRSPPKLFTFNTRIATFRIKVSQKYLILFRKQFTDRVSRAPSVWWRSPYRPLQIYPSKRWIHVPDNPKNISIDSENKITDCELCAPSVWWRSLYLPLQIYSSKRRTHVSNSLSWCGSWLFSYGSYPRLSAPCASSTQRRPFALSACQPMRSGLRTLACYVQSFPAPFLPYQTACSATRTPTWLQDRLLTPWSGVTLLTWKSVRWLSPVS